MELIVGELNSKLKLRVTSLNLYLSTVLSHLNASIDLYCWCTTPQLEKKWTTPRSRLAEIRKEAVERKKREGKKEIENKRRTKRSRMREPIEMHSSTDAWAWTEASNLGTRDETSFADDTHKWHSKKKKTFLMCEYQSQLLKRRIPASFIIVRRKKFTKIIRPNLMNPFATK